MVINWIELMHSIDKAQICIFLILQYWFIDNMITWIDWFMD